MWAELAINNATQARKEPGCLQFDVVLPRDTPELGILIEKYTDEGAWNFHFRQPYCQEFMNAIQTVLVERSRVICDRFEPAERK